MNFSNNYSMNTTNAMNLLPIRFDSCLKEPILQKINILSQLIQESMATNIKDIQNKFTALVEDIFGLGFGMGSALVSTDWSLKLISRNYNSREFDTIYNFLSPNGCLFHLIRQLMSDPLNRFEFPKALLPIPTKLSLEEGVIPLFYANKIPHGFSNTISVNPFEYFLFHFAYYIMNDNSTNIQLNPYNLEQMMNANTDPSNIVYFSLLESYLIHFVPLSSNQMISTPNSSPHSSIWQSLSSTTSNLLHLGTANSPKSLTSPTGQTSTLFKSSILNLKPLLSGTQNNESTQQLSHRLIHDSLGSEIGKCETFLIITTEMWLNHAIPHSMVKRNSSPSKQNCFTPNSDHMRTVRILIKHLHYFANSCDKTNDSMNGIDVMPLDNIKRSIWSQKYNFQKRLYTFLRLSFDRWPNDTSFRLPLETWLSYIQPWRYVIPSTYPLFSPTIDRNESKTESILDNRWKQFISENLLFYSVIFRQLIPRFSRIMDLSSYRNAVMISRLTKVFSQNSLSLWIREAENSMINDSSPHIMQNNWPTNSRISLLSPTIRQQNFGSLSTQKRYPLIELEANNFEYIPLFCPAIKPLIQQLLIEISKAINIVNEMISKTQINEQITKDSGVSFFHYIFSFFQFSEDMTQSNENKKLLVEKNKTKNNLEMASKQLSHLFEVPQQMITTFSHSSEESSDQRQRQSSEELFEDKNGTFRLTSFGRSQVLNKVIKPELNVIEVNPDKQPVRTFEFYYLVYLFIFISDWINRKYETQIDDLYNKPGFVGIFFKQLISGPISFVKTVKTGNALPPQRTKQELKPRINLRFMANKFYIFYTLIIYFLVYMFNYSLLSFTSLLFAMFVTYITTKSLLYYVSSY